MHKLSILVASTITLGASAAMAGGPPDTVVGAGRFGDAPETFAKVEIMAKSDADGSNAKGRFRLRQGETDIVGEITCLFVAGNWAAAGGYITKAENPAVLGNPFIQVTRDNGEGWDDSDESQTLRGDDVIPENCEQYVNFDPRFDVSRGNYEIKDR